MGRCFRAHIVGLKQQLSQTTGCCPTPIAAAHSLSGRQNGNLLRAYARRRNGSGMAAEWQPPYLSLRRPPRAVRGRGSACPLI